MVCTRLRSWKSSRSNGRLRALPTGQSGGLGRVLQIHSFGPPDHNPGFELLRKIMQSSRWSRSVRRDLGLHRSRCPQRPRKEPTQVSRERLCFAGRLAARRLESVPARWSTPGVSRLEECPLPIRAAVHRVSPSSWTAI